MTHPLVEMICNRVSYPRLTEPAPDQDVLENIYRSALRAPDHMLLRPWRYLVIQGDARVALGQLFCDAALADDPQVSISQQEKFRTMPMRAPMIVVGIAKPSPHPKVPLEEQLVSCGVGMGYMLLSLQAEGFGGIWRTGPLASDETVRAGLGVKEHETIVGFLYLGTPQGEGKSVPHFELDDFFVNWNEPVQ